MHCPKFLQGKINLDQRIIIFFEELSVITLIYLPLLLYISFDVHLFQNVIFDISMIFAVLVQIGAIYSAFIEPRIIKVRKINIELKDLSDNIWIVFFSDLHLGPYKKYDFVNKIVIKVNELNPDIILIGGDFITGNKNTFKYLTPLKNLQAEYSILAVLGNHDYDLAFDFEKARYNLADELEKFLYSLNISVLRNSSKLIKTKKGNINIVGLDDLWAEKINVNQAFSQTSEEYHTIALFHNPDSIKKIIDKKIDMFLAGHTHGNTFRFPPGRPLIPFIRNIKLPPRYLKGFHKYRKIPIYITSGVGEAVTRMRFLGNFPELIVIDLK